MPDSPIPYPLDPISVSGTQITVDQYVNAPEVITRTIAALAGQRFYAHRIFSPGPAPQGGAYLFERPNPLLTDLYAARRAQEMAPGTQAPILTFARGVPMVARTRKIGGKFSLTREERSRNRVDLIDKAIIQSRNTMVRDIEIMALAELNAVIAATSRIATAGSTWATAAAITAVNRTGLNQPVADIINVVTTIDLEERGHVIDSAIFNPTDWATLVKTTALGLRDGVNAGAVARQLLSDNGITNIDITPRQAQGKVKFYEAGAVGKWGNEFPLGQRTWIDEETDQTWWYQWTAGPIFAVDDQYAMIELQGV